jgi:hypothetical protein
VLVPFPSAFSCCGFHGFQQSISRTSAGTLPLGLMGLLRVAAPEQFHSSHNVFPHESMLFMHSDAYKSDSSHDMMPVLHSSSKFPANTKAVQKKCQVCVNRQKDCAPCVQAGKTHQCSYPPSALLVQCAGTDTLIHLCCSTILPQALQSIHP